MGHRARLISAFFISLALLLCHSAPLARADDGPTVAVKYSKGSTTLLALQNGVKCFSNRQYEFHHLPSELTGLPFTCREAKAPADVAIDAPAGAVVYLLFDSDKNGPKETGSGVANLHQKLSGDGWTRLADTDYGSSSKNVAIYKRTFTDHLKISIAAAGYTGVIVAAARLAVEQNGSGGNAGGGGAVTVHEDKPIEVSGAGTPTPILKRQNSIKALYVIETESGSLGEASDFILTMPARSGESHTPVGFATPVGEDMHLVLRDVITSICLKYPRWDAARAEFSFEDKYVGHDGGSIGAAMGTLILSCIQGFNIDPHLAMTGDVSADGKVRKIGGVAAKVRGAKAANCTIIAMPYGNADQLMDAMIYDGLSTVIDEQVIGIDNLDEATAVARVDRDAKLAKAISLFGEVQQSLAKSSGYIHTEEAQTKLAQILALAPKHLSAQILLAVAQNKQPKTLSAAASRYYALLAVNSVTPFIFERADPKSKQPAPEFVKDALKNLQKVRQIADPAICPLVDSLTMYLRSLSGVISGNGTEADVQAKLQAVVDALAKIQTDRDIMETMLQEGM